MERLGKCMKYEALSASFCRSCSRDWCKSSEILQGEWLRRGPPLEAWLAASQVCKMRRLLRICYFRSGIQKLKKFSAPGASPLISWRGAVLLDPDGGSAPETHRHFALAIYVSTHIFNRLQNDLYCVGWGVKLYSLTNRASLRGAMVSMDPPPKDLRFHFPCINIVVVDKRVAVKRRQFSPTFCDHRHSTWVLRKRITTKFWSPIGL